MSLFASAKGVETGLGGFPEVSGLSRAIGRPRWKRNASGEDEP